MINLPEKLLLVEDHRDTAAIFKRILGDYGYDVFLAFSVAEAISLFEGTRFDVMISDIGLPDGSGLDVMRHVKANRLIPAVAVSALSSEEDIKRSVEAGFLAHMAKPMDITSLEKLIACLSQQSTPPKPGSG